MANNTNKQKAVDAIWENPGRVFGCDFRQSGRYWENLRGGDYDERGKIRLAQTANGGNIMVFYNGGSRVEKTDIFTYLDDYVLHGSGFKDVLQHVAKVYNLTLEYSAEEKTKLAREALAREVAPSLIEALRLNPTGEAAAYLANVRGLQADGVHFGELTTKSIAAAKQSLRNRNFAFTEDDFNNLFVSREAINEDHRTAEDVAQWGYNLVIPYYHNGIVKGFVLRNIRKNYTGNTKYLYTEGLGRGGYCDRLTHGEPAVIVEGQMDAVRLIQAGEHNVIAMGGAKIGEEIAKLLKSRGISQVTYIPDLEYNERKEKITDTTAEAIRAFQSVKVDDEPVVTHLYVAEVPTPPDMFTTDKYKVSKDGKVKKYKTDADTYGKDGGNLSAVIDMGEPSWCWELTNLMNWAKSQDTANGTVNVCGFQNRFDEIYNRIVTPYERERAKQFIKGNEDFKAFGVTPEALADADEWNRNRKYTDAVKAATADLQNAVENGANPVKIGEAVERLAEAQGQNTRDEWEQQLNQSFADELDAIRNQPETLKTKWELGNITKKGEFAKYGTIEFWPADISVFCAATSHGKTAILFQSAFDLLKRYPNKTFLYVSCEENKRQLLERALNVYIDIQTTEDGKTVEAPGVPAGQPCFISQTRKKTIKAVLRGDVPPLEYAAYMGVSEHYNSVTKQVLHWVGRYEQEIRPRLKLIHTDGTAESITANVLHYVKEFQNDGIEVGGVFVDYMQLLTSDGKNFSRTDELKDVCKALKRCVASTELPVIIAAQLNRTAISEGIDEITVANIGEGADIERIAHDIYLVWQVDKTKRDKYISWVDEKKPNGVGPDGETKWKKTGRKVEAWNYKNSGTRSTRIFTKNNELKPYNPDGSMTRELKTGYLYVEQMKARDGKTEGWGLFTFDGERGHVGENDKDAMKQ